MLSYSASQGNDNMPKSVTERRLPGRLRTTKRAVSVNDEDGVGPISGSLDYKLGGPYVGLSSNCNNMNNVKKQRHRSTGTDYGVGFCMSEVTPRDMPSGASSRNSPHTPDSLSSSHAAGGGLSNSLRKLFPFDIFNYSRQRTKSETSSIGGRDELTESQGSPINSTELDTIPQGRTLSCREPPNIIPGPTYNNNKLHRSKSPIQSFMDRLRSLSLNLGSPFTTGGFSHDQDPGIVGFHNRMHAGFSECDNGGMDHDDECFYDGNYKRSHHGKGRSGGGLVGGYGGLPDPNMLPKESPRSCLTFSKETLSSSSFLSLDKNSRLRKGKSLDTDIEISEPVKSTVKDPRNLDNLDFHPPDRKAVSVEDNSPSRQHTLLKVPQVIDGRHCKSSHPTSSNHATLAVTSQPGVNVHNTVGGSCSMHHQSLSSSVDGPRFGSCADHNCDSKHKRHAMTRHISISEEPWSTRMLHDSLRSNIVHENDKFIVFKDKSDQGPDIAKITEESLNNLNAVYSIFMRYNTCYDLLPVSSKLVVFDTELIVRRAFFGLVYNGVRSAPLWDASQQRFVGILTITDFVKILAHYHSSVPRLTIEEFEKQTLSQWRSTVIKTQPQGRDEFIHIGPEESLFVAVSRLLDNKIHRLPVLDLWSGNVLHILTHKRILKYLTLHMEQLPIPLFLQKRLEECGIGTYADIAVVHEDTSVIEALKVFINRRVSALPVVTAQGVLVDIYAKFDTINLAATQTYNNLDITVMNALKYRQDFEGVATCKRTDTLIDVIHKIVNAGVHRLVVVDDDKHVIGVVSLSDLLKYLVIDPYNNENSNNLFGAS